MIRPRYSSGHGWVVGRHWRSGHALGVRARWVALDGVRSMDALDGARSVGLRHSACTVVSPQAEGFCLLTSVVLKDRGAAQLTMPANVNLNRRVHPPPKLRRLTPPANDTTSLLQRPQFAAFLHDAFRGRGLGGRRKGRKAEGEGSFMFAGGWGGVVLH